MKIRSKKTIVLIIILLFPISSIYTQNSNFSVFAKPAKAFSMVHVNSFAINSITHSPSPRVADYTLLIYMIGSDLEAKSYAATNNLIQMKNAGHSSRINIIVETGGGGGKIDGKRFIDFSKVQRHEVLNGTVHTLVDLGQRDMGSSSTLSDFIQWGALKFPAKKYVLILWDHGSGLNGFGKDLIFNNDILSPLELKEALLTAEISTHIKVELIGFDACLMSSLEIASRLENVTDFVVSSEEVEPLWGWNYTAIIQNLSANSHEPGSSLGMSIVDSYVKLSKYLSASEKFGADKQITLSVIDVTKIPQLISQVS